MKIPNIFNHASLCLKGSILALILSILVGGCVSQSPSTINTITLPSDTVRYPPGPNQLLVAGYCNGCHSADYVLYQPPQDRAGWQAVLDKMQTRFGIPDISLTDQALLLDYLVSVNGTGL